MNVSKKLFLVFVLFVVIIIWFTPIYSTDLFCPPVVDYCDELGDKFSLIEYMKASIPL